MNTISSFSSPPAAATTAAAASTLAGNAPAAPRDAAPQGATAPGSAFAALLAALADLAQPAPAGNVAAIAETDGSEAGAADAPLAPGADAALAGWAIPGAFPSTASLSASGSAAGALAAASVRQSAGTTDLTAFTTPTPPQALAAGTAAPADLSLASEPANGASAPGFVPAPAEGLADASTDAAGVQRTAADRLPGSGAAAEDMAGLAAAPDMASAGPAMSMFAAGQPRGTIAAEPAGNLTTPELLPRGSSSAVPPAFEAAPATGAPGALDGTSVGQSAGIRTGAEWRGGDAGESAAADTGLHPLAGGAGVALPEAASPLTRGAATTEFATARTDAPSVHRAALASAPHDPSFPGDLAAEIRLLMHAGAQRAELRLNPAELGPVHIQLSVTGQTADISFAAAHGLTRDSITQSLPALRDMLASQGVSLGQTGVAAGGQGGNSSNEPAREQRVPTTAETSSNGAAEQPSHRIGTMRASRGVLDLYA